MMKIHWWKVLAIVLLIYVVIAGFLGDVPRQPILQETIRNLYFHVTMWFSMFVLAIVSLIYSIIYLLNGSVLADARASAFAKVALLFGLIGIATGMIWVNYTWNATSGKLVFWVKEDIKLNAAAMGVLIYFVYHVLRTMVENTEKKGRLAAVYNIFAFVLLVLFTLVVPRLSASSLHPGNAGNPGFNIYDIDSAMRTVFYPAVIGWSLLGVWIASLRVRYTLLKIR